jgi:hypothetical protein
MKAKEQMTGEILRYLPIANNIQVVVYVANYGVTEEKMQSHFHEKIATWLKEKEITLVGYWIARHGDLLSLIMQVYEYRADWSEIPEIYCYYRANSKGVLMEVRHQVKGYIA